MSDKPETDMLELTVRRFVSQVAAKQPTPGGGSVAGVAASLAVGLARMSLNYSRGKKAFADASDLHERLRGRFLRGAAVAEALTEEDAQAFALYQEAAGGDGPDKAQREQLALAAAINVPRELAKLCLSLLDDLHTLLPVCTAWLTSDLKAAGALAAAAVAMCEYNVRVNTAQLEDPEQAQQLQTAAEADTARARKAHAALEHKVDSKST